MSPAENFARVDLDQLWLPFLTKLLETVAACAQRGAEYHATSGYRDFAAQKVLWTQGRTAKGRIVTDAGPGESAHNFGLACDFFRVGPDGKPNWAADAYDVLGDEAVRHGLVWGGEFHHPVDRLHLQWPGYLTAHDMAPLKTVYLKHPDAPLSAVFEFLNAKDKQT